MYKLCNDVMTTEDSILAADGEGQDLGGGLVLFYLKKHSKTLVRLDALLDSKACGSRMDMEHD